MASKPIVEALWVIDSTGKNYYTLANKEKFSEDKFSNVILSVNQLALKISNEAINRFNIMDMLFMVLRPENIDLFIVCRINPKIKEKKYQKHLQALLEEIEGKINLEMLKKLDDENIKVVFSILDKFVTLS